MPVLSNRNVQKKESKEQKPVYNQNDAIPPELLVRRDNTVRYEKDGPIYATDGKVGTLKKVVVDENSAEVIEIIVCPDGATDFIVLPSDVVDRSSGAALFITLNRVQFAERQTGSPGYTRNHFAKADLKALLHRKDGSRPLTPRRSVTNVGTDFVETPLAPAIERLKPMPPGPATMSSAAD
jgi:sporulation protein YlmC with PRC-barrel domain